MMPSWTPSRLWSTSNQRLPAHRRASPGPLASSISGPSVDRNQTRVDEPVTLKVTVYGQGNISTASDPVWPEMDGWRIFDADSTLNTQIENGLVSGSHTYERLMVPTMAGQFTVPPIEYTYYDPTLDQYTTVATEPMAINRSTRHRRPRRHHGSRRGSRQYR